MGSWISTPVTAPFLYGITYIIGRQVFIWWTGQSLPLRFRFRELSEIFSKTPRIFCALTIGGILAGLPAAIVSYYLTYLLLQVYRQDRERVIAYLNNARFLKFIHVQDEFSEQQGENTQEDAHYMTITQRLRTLTAYLTHEKIILLIGGGAIVTISFMIALLMYWNTRRVDAEIRTANQFLAVFQRLETASKDAILYHRNFMLMGTDSDLALYDQYRDAVQHEIALLRHLSATDASRGYAQRFEQTLTTKFAALDEMTTVRQHEGLGERLERMFADIIRPAADDVQQLLQDLNDQENQLLREILTRSEWKSRETILLVVVGNGITAVILLVIFTLLAREINGRIRLEHSLKQATYRAEEASQAKSRFLANMSHELRTPLNGILGYTQLFRQDPALTAKHRRALETIHQSGEHLLALIDDVLDLAKIEAGQIELEPAWYSLPAALKTVLDLIRIRAYQRQLEFIPELPPTLPRRVYGDETHLKQVLLNMLGNAVKFTPRGRIEFRVTHQENDPRRLRFEVRDTGIGMTPDSLANLFQPFQRVHDRQLRIEGTGLGLSISQQILARMGTSMQVESAPGQGSRFWFDLTFAETAADPADETPPRQRVIGFTGNRRKILIVDDQPDNCDVLSQLLQPLGFEVQEVSDGQRALDCAPHFRPDVVLIDLALAGPEGVETIRRLRALPEFDQGVIVAMSDDMTHTASHAANAPAYDALLAKPVRFEELLRLLRHHAGITWVYAACDATETSPSSQAMLPPSREVLQKLYAAAQIGDVRDIQHEAGLLQAQSEFAAFARYMLDLAADFQIQHIQHVVSAYLEENHAHHQTTGNNSHC